MRKFEFSNSDNKADFISVEINHDVFMFNPMSLDVMNACSVYKQNLIPILDMTKKDEVSEEEVNALLISSCMLIKETINKILGIGAAEKIFYNRNMDFNDYEELINFLLTEITVFYKTGNNAYGKHIVTSIS